MLGNTISKMNLTVTKLLHDVDVVLGMTWLQLWNPLIDWVNQVMYIRREHGWDKTRGLFLHAEHAVGTVKVLDDSLLASLPMAPNFDIIQNPKFWDYTAARSWTTIFPKGGNDAQTFFDSLGKDNQNSFNSSAATKRMVQYGRVAGTVQKKTTSRIVGRRQMILPKQMQKLMKKGETCFLAAVVLPKKSGQQSPLEHQ